MDEYLGSVGIASASPTLPSPTDERDSKPSEGRVSVPREPTPEMLAIGRNAFPGICGVMSGTDIEGRQPTGLYSEEKTLRRVRAVWRRMVDAAEGVELYRPCNGSEGDRFMARWCSKCARDNLNEDTGEGGCEIIAYTMALDEDDEDYPRAWRQDGGNVRCTAFTPRDGSPAEGSQHLSTVGEARTGEASQRPNQ